MTKELEKQFFDTFNIELIGCNDNENCTGVLDCTQCPNAKYPQITYRILLELICVLTKSKAMLPIICSENTQDLKDEILWDLIKAYTQFKKDIKQQVQAIFEEWKNDR